MDGEQNGPSSDRPEQANISMLFCTHSSSPSLWIFASMKFCTEVSDSGRTVRLEERSRMRVRCSCSWSSSSFQPR